MAILEEEVWVNIVGGNVRHYENKGYKILKYIDKYGVERYKIGSKILVKVEDLPKGSDVEVTKICDVCGKHVENTTIFEINKCRKNGDGKDRCFGCGKDKARDKLLNSIRYENSLEFYAKKNDKIYLIDEYSDKNIKKPSEIASGSGQEYLWNCPDCESEYQTTAVSRTHMSSNCPYCAGHKVNHTNCLWTVKPEIASLLKNEENGYNLSVGSNKMVEFVCHRCGNEQRKTVNSVSRQGFLACLRCGDGISYGEKFMSELLNQINVEYEREKRFDWITKRRYDFYIPLLNCIIETHGLQHYERGFNKGGRSVEDEQENDNLKKKLAIENGIDKYIVIDCRYSELEYIKESILASDLTNLYNLNNVNWNKCNNFAIRNTMVKTICDLWNKGIKNTVKIGEIVKLERSAVVRYLKRGVKLGWCDYNPKQVMKENGITSGALGKKPVVQLSLNDEFIKIWESGRDVKRSLKIDNINAACKGRYKQAGGFKWMYLDDYEKQMSVIK